MGEVDITEEREALRKDLEEKCRKAAEESGEKFEIIEKVIPFTNDDVPKYLERLAVLEKRSRESMKNDRDHYIKAA